MSEVRIRRLTSHAERKACVALQEETWGEGFSDRVPTSILMIADEIGGVASGAFDGDRLVAFVFGLTGVRDGLLLHWSDMLAVHPAYRGRGIGLLLKRHQRELLLERGVENARWTFDPLVARNAHINLNRLGATVAEYRRDLYGDSDSPLHAGIGTDRLVAEWALGSERVGRHLEGRVEAPQPDLVVNPLAEGASTGGGRDPRPGEALLEPGGDAVGILIPSDLMGVLARDLGLARAWRASVRRAFERCFAAGYVGVGVRRGGATATYFLVPALAR